jgi:hypothetical protein
VTLVPAGIVLRGTLRGAALLAENFAIGREIAASAAVAAVAAATAMFAARTRLAVLAVLGLLGSLVLALLVLALVPWPGVRETALPWAAALALVLLPYAVVFRRLLQNAGGTALHVARLARARELIWMLKARREFWMAFLLFGWAYWDLTAGAILAPVRWTPVTARLYNLMHYGQTAALSALVAAAFAAPLLALGAALLTRRWWARG